MAKKKAPKMPVVPPEDGIERHTAYTRLNPSGHQELVVDDDEETLNELSDDIIDMIESVAFGGPLATGGGAGSPEQPESDRRHNNFTPQLVGSSGDQARAAGEDVNNLTSTTPQASDGPERSRAKSKLKTSTIRGVGPRNKYIAGFEGDGLDGATRNESFTGTGAIAISPGGGYDLVDDDEDDDDQDPDKQTESSMNRRNDVVTEQVNQLLAEWEPSFAGGEYSSGDYQMPSPTGDGVAERKPKKDKVGKYDTDTSQNGKEWPRDHKDTEAMSSVGDDGTDDGSGGYHDSSSGDTSDGYQSETGHNWPDQAKNDGSGVAEPFEGDRWSDGGTLKGTAPDEFDNGGTPQKMPSTGPITGTSGPQLGEPSEGWSPRGMASLMEGDINLQALFDSYARNYEMVCVEDFQALCNAHGASATIDEVSLLQLMETNQSFIFYQGEDANGPYWCPTPIAEEAFPGAAPPFGSKDSDGDSDGSSEDEDDSDSGSSSSGKPWENDSDDDAVAESAKPWEDDDDDEECDDDEDEDCSMSEGENRRPFGRAISELQVRPAEQEAGLYNDGPAGPGMEPGMGPGPQDYAGDPALGAGIGPESSPISSAPGLGGPSAYDERLGASQGLEGLDGPGQFGDACPECGAPNTGEATCAECGAEMGELGEADQFTQPDTLGRGGLEDAADVDNWDEYYGDDMGEWMPPEEDYGGGRIEGDPSAFGASDVLNRAGSGVGIPHIASNKQSWQGEGRMTNSPAIKECLHNFMQSARRILEGNQEFSPLHIGEALRYSWAYHARRVNPHTTPTKVRTTLEGLANRFPSFAIVLESSSETMDSPDGTVIGTGGASNSSAHLEDQPGPDEMEDKGEPLGKSQVNDLEGTPEIKGTAKGMDGKGSVAKAVKENVSRLSRHVQKAIREGASSLRGKYKVQFALVVTEGKAKNRTPLRIRLAEALADAEELLQLHAAKDVDLEANFADATGAVVLKHNVPLLTIKPRGLLCSEGKALFRFHRNAENFANELVSEGYTCRVVGHNWGRAVLAKTPIAIAENAFRTLVGQR